MSGEYVDGPDGLFGPGDDVARYAAEVRAELADLTSEQNIDLLEDLEDHLREVAAEDGDLWIRLGTPREYARELRSSAGLPPRSEAGFTWTIRPPRIGLVERFAARVAARLGHLWGTVLANPAGEAVVGFLPSLRPAWWVLRGWLLVVLIQFMVGSDSSNTYPIPSVGGSAVLGILLLIAAIPASVWFAQRAPLKGRRRRLLLLAHAAAGVLAFAAFTDMQAGTPSYVQPTSYSNVSIGGQGLYDNGQQVTNLFVYDKDGKLIDGALVYSQDGQPIQVSQTDGNTFASQWMDGNGSLIPNAFPLHQAHIDHWGTDNGVVNKMVVVPWINIQTPKTLWEQPLVPTDDTKASAPANDLKPTAPANDPKPSAQGAQPSAPGAPAPSATSAPVQTPSGFATTK